MYRDAIGMSDMCAWVCVWVFILSMFALCKCVCAFVGYMYDCMCYVNACMCFMYVCMCVRGIYV